MRATNKINIVNIFSNLAFIVIIFSDATQQLLKRLLDYNF